MFIISQISFSGSTVSFFVQEITANKLKTITINKFFMKNNFMNNMLKYSFSAISDTIFNLFYLEYDIK